jgi:hypothetical protein
VGESVMSRCAIAQKLSRCKGRLMLPSHTSKEARYSSNSSSTDNEYFYTQRPTVSVGHLYDVCLEKYRTGKSAS